MTYSQFKAQIVVPAERTNLITNPSFELATTGWTASGAGVSISVNATYQRRGAQSCEVTTATNVASGAYYGISLTSGTQYTFSLDVLDVAGQSFTLYFADNAGTLVGTATTWTGTGYWKRRSVTYTAASSAAHRLYIIRASIASTTKYYIDGAQLEVGAQSTYLDGDMTGFLPGETAYRWSGTPHASTSWRSGQTRTGGTFVNIGTYARILNVVGLGMTPLSNIAVPSTMGGSYYQNTVAGERPFSFIVNMNGNGDYGAIARNRTALINALKPDLVTTRQPVLMQIDQLDGSSLEIAETLMIPAVYEGGLEMDGSGDNYNEKAAINFRAYSPAIYQQGEKGAALGYQTAVSYFANIGYRDTDGTWKAMGRGANALINCMAKGPDGSVYVGGNFTKVIDAAGSDVANTGYIAKWNGTAWEALGSGLGNYVFAIAIDAAGNVYAGGSFLNAGGVAAADYIAKWDGANWTALGTGTGGTVYAITIGKDGLLYAGGNFTNLTDANGDYISKWNGAAWVSMGTGMQGGIVYALATGKDGAIYAGGAFTTAGGVTNTAKIAKWNGTAWLPLSTGMNGTVKTIKIAPSGAVFAGGLFTTSGGITTNYIARWNGANWEAIAGGVNGRVDTIDISPRSEVYAGGVFTRAGDATTMPPDYSLPDRMAIYYGGAWRPLDINVADGSAAIYSILTLPDGRVYIGGGWSGTTATGATKTASNVGSASAYPKVIFTGPGSVFQLYNFTTRKAIYLALTILSGETATLDLNPLHVSFVSSFRGNIMSTILPGSDLTWELLPGANNVSAYMFGSTSAASKIIMTWKDGYWSTDGAVR